MSPQLDERNRIVDAKIPQIPESAIEGHRISSQWVRVVVSQEKLPSKRRSLEFSSPAQALEIRLAGIVDARQGYGERAHVPVDLVGMLGCWYDVSSRGSEKLGFAYTIYRGRK